MIIKYSVQDNNFYDLMMFFGRNIKSILLGYITFKDYDENDIENKFNVYKYRNQIFNKMINPNSDYSRTTLDRNLISCDVFSTDNNLIYNTLKEEFISFINSKVGSKYIRTCTDEDSDSTKKYLIERFTVDIVDCFMEEFENGESFYLFSNADVIINQ